MIRYELSDDDDRLGVRALYFSPDFVEWLENILPDKTADRSRDLVPADQVEAFFDRFLTDEHMSGVGDFQNITPQSHGVYEMKTTDVRMFGWFYRKGIFIAARGCMKKDVKGNYDAERKVVEIFRDSLDLPPPSFIRGKLNVREIL